MIQFLQVLQENILTIITAIFGGGSLLAYLFERRKNAAVAQSAEADADGKDIANGKEIINMYKGALDDMTERAETKLQEVIEMYDRKIKVLEDEIRLHKRMQTALKKENSELRRKLKDAGNSTK